MAKSATSNRTDASLRAAIDAFLSSARYANPRTVMCYIRPGAGPEAVSQATDLLDLGRGHH